MLRTMPHAVAAWIAAGVVLIPTVAFAADIEVLSSVAMKAPLIELIPAFEQASGTKVHAIYDSAAAVKRKIETGDAFCVGILFTSAVDGLVKTGAMTDPAPLAHIGVGVAYRRADSKPAVATMDELKATLLATKTLSVSDPALGGVSSAYFKRVVDQLGIAPQLAPKTILTKPGEGAKPVAAGQADIGIVTMSEVASLPGVGAAPLFPSDPKTQAWFSAGLSSGCKERAAAQALVAYLRTPNAASVFKAKNIDPD